MSVQNPERVVTKQDLADFYEQILPYLGGMPEILANKFSKGDMYSTDEKMIGQWIDGKPLYQKTVNFGALPNNTTKSVAHEISNIDFIADYSCVASNGTVFMSIPKSVPSEGNAGGIGINCTKTNVEITTGIDRSSYTTTYAVLKYTKTTDSPISIGSDTDYSADEKIIGTWIGGEPLWQKTIELSSLSVGDNTITHGISNFGHLVNAFGYVVREGAGEPIPKSSTASIGWNTGISGFSNTQFYVEIGSGYTGQYAITGGYVTLQYTKTT